MTNEQFNKLKTYETTLFNALHFGFARLGDREMVGVLNQVSMELFNDGINGACGQCTLRKLKNIARPYFQMKEEMDKKAQLEAEKKTQQEAEEKARIEAEEQAQKEKELEKKIAEEGKVQPINNNIKKTNKYGQKTVEKPKRTGRGKGAR